MKTEWWRGAIIYQICPRSFFDANGDGIGDLAGIRQKLDYVASLGVDAIWISPFFKSPMRDFGYDVSDYRAVDPIFGNNEDFYALIRAAHERGLKVIVDMVLASGSGSTREGSGFSPPHLPEAVGVAKAASRLGSRRLRACTGGRSCVRF